MILNGRNIDGLRAPRIATLTRRRFVAGAACAVACAAAGLLVGCGSASRSAEVAAIEPYVSPYDWSGLVRDGEKLSYYENDALCSRWGIDVSEHQGNDIDWAAVADAGYAPMLYGNQRDLLRLAPELRAAYPVWLAEYDVEAPTAPLDFAIWQYTNAGTVPGIPTDVDLNVWLEPQK